jgi:hypothetical protein
MGQDVPFTIGQDRYILIRRGTSQPRFNQNSHLRSQIRYRSHTRSAQRLWYSASLGYEATPRKPNINPCSIIKLWYGWAVVLSRALYQLNKGQELWKRRA